MTKIIPLRNKQKLVIAYSIVSDEDYEQLNKYKWHLCPRGYVTGHINKRKWKMHRYIQIELLGNDIIPRGVIDHINNNKLENTRENLRIVTIQQNNQNKLKNKNATSKYYGVSFCNKQKKWRSMLYLKPTTFLNAYYQDELHAAHQYNLWISNYNVDFYKVNNIETPINFIPYEYKVKKDIDLPRSITRFGNNKFHLKISFQKIQYSKVYNTLKEATDKMMSLKNEHNKKLEQDRLLKPIVRNSKEQCIIELFNKHNLKVAETIVDEDLYYVLTKFKWCLNNGYVSGKVEGKNVLLHRFILNYIDTEIVDHIDGDILNNTVSNLRVVTRQQNSFNKKKSSSSCTSKYIGVSFNIQFQKWIAYITINSKRFSKSFLTEIEAAKYRDLLTCAHFGEHGKLNFPMI